MLRDWWYTKICPNGGWLSTYRNSAIRIYLKEKMLFLLMFKEFDDAYLEMDRVRVFKISSSLFARYLERWCMGFIRCTSTPVPLTRWIS